MCFLVVLHVYASRTYPIILISLYQIFLNLTTGEALADKLSDRKCIDDVKGYLPGDKLKDAFDEAATEIANELKFIASLGDQLEEAVQNAIVQAIMRSRRFNQKFDGKYDCECSSFIFL